MNTIKIHGQDVPVLGENSELLIESSYLKEWASNIDKCFSVHSITAKSVITAFNNPNRVVFALISVEVTGPEGDWTFSLFLRGPSVAVLAIVKFEGKDYVISILQPRLPSGGMLIELPAGMLDGEIDTKAVALRELEEEAKLISILDLKKDDLIYLSEIFFPEEKSILLSPGGSTERTHLFAIKKDISKEQFETLSKTVGGLEEEGEQTKVVLIPLSEIHRKSPDAKTLATLYLYNKYIEELENK